MRKNDLIKKLQAIKGNPDVVLWNGMVGDWMPIGEITESYLTRCSKNYYVRAVEAEMKIKKKDWNFVLPEEEKTRLEKSHAKNNPWEHNEWVTQEDVDAKRQQVKNIIYINAKPRGIKTFDRLGGLEY